MWCTRSLAYLLQLHTIKLIKVLQQTYYYIILQHTLKEHTFRDTIKKENRGLELL